MKEAVVWPSEEEIVAFREDMLRKYAHVFKEKGSPPNRDVEHTIPLKDPRQKMRPAVYPVAEKHLPKFTEVFKQRVDAGIWVPVRTSNASPVMVIGKKEADDIRIVVNLKERNANTDKHVSPLPRMDQIINLLASRQLRSSFDVSGAFEQCRVADEDVDKNTLSTIFGTVAGKVAIQGHFNSPNTCQRMMTSIYSGQIGRSLLVYVDDCFQISDSWDAHKSDTEEFLRATAANHISLAKHKWQLIPKEMTALGRRIDLEGISLDPSHVDALLRFREPSDKKEIERWCRLLTWCEIDLPDVGRLNAPISKLKGKEQFRWTATCRAAFEKIKDRIKESVTAQQKRVALRQGEMAHPSTFDLPTVKESRQQTHRKMITSASNFSL